MKDIVSHWTAQVQRDEYDEYDECIIIFPPEFCEQTDQREGDLYDFDVVDGRIVMTFLKHAAAIRQFPIAIHPGDDQTAYSVYFPVALVPFSI